MLKNKLVLQSRSSLEDGTTSIKLSGRIRTNFPISEIKLFSSGDEKEEESELIERAKYDDIDFTPPKGVIAELKRGLAWHEEGHSGDGLMPETVSWARRMANGADISPDKAVKMRAWLARHESDKTGKGFDPGEEGYPSPGRVAWALWGGDAAVGWSQKIVRQMEAADKKSNRTAFVFDDSGEVEERTKRGRPKKHYVIEGIASSTSIDSHGTEMSLSSLTGMKRQIAGGVPILPSHASQNSGGIGEWDEVIGRTVEASVDQVSKVVNAAAPGDTQFTMNVRSVLYGDEPKAQALIRRIGRGEPIGQSIGGWFENVEVIERDGNIERVIVQDVTLDHIAITRAPSNPDSEGLMSLSMRSQLDEIITEANVAEETRATVVPYSKMPTAPVDESWSFTNEERDEVLGDPPNFNRLRKAHLYYDKETPELMSAYKLPIAKMREGKLTVYFRGVQAAMAALNGARGGVKIDDEYREPIYNNIKKYYALFDKDAPELKGRGYMDDEEMREDYDEDEKKKMKRASEEVVENVSEQNIDSAENASEVLESQPIEERAVEEITSSTEDSVNDKDKALETFDKNEYDVQNAVSNVTDNDVNSANTQQMSGDTMTENDLAKIAELMQRAVAPLTERVNALETSPKEEIKEEAVKVDPETEELRNRLAKAESMIQRVIKNPIRRGRHGNVQFEQHGVMANDFYTRSALEARESGNEALPHIVSAYAEELSKDHLDSRLQKRHIIKMLQEGLRAAAMDGLLQVPSSDWSQ